MIILYYEWKRYIKSALKIAILCALLVLLAIPFLPFVQEPELVEEMRQALDMFPDLLLSTFGLHAGQNFTSPARYLSFVFIFVFVIAGLFAAWLGGRCFSKERADGTIDLLLQKPLHRWQIMLFKILANLLAMATFLVLFYLMYRGILFLYGLFQLPVDAQTLPTGSILIALFALMTLIFSLSVLISMPIPTDKIAVPITIGLTAFLYLVHAAQSTDSSLAAMESVSPFHYIRPQAVAAGDPAPVAAFFLISLLFLSAAFALLYNNDIRKKFTLKGTM